VLDGEKNINKSKSSWVLKVQAHFGGPKVARGLKTALHLNFTSSKDQKLIISVRRANLSVGKIASHKF
jgi:hypothetical protein